MRKRLPVCLFPLLLVAFAAPSRAADEPAAAPQLRLTPEKDSVAFWSGKNRVIVLQLLNVPFKPYIKTLCSPSGVNVLLDSPADHKHHHALMFAIGAAGVDFWAETPECGRQEPAAVGFKPDQLEVKLPISWRSAKSELILNENRVIRAHPNAEATLLTWTSDLRPVDGKPVRLTGSHYFGLGMRFIRSMDKNGTWITPDGKLGPVVRGDERLTPGKWCAYTAKADGKDVTVAMFDGEKNIRPALWFTMKDSFAYISATVNLWKEPLEMKEPTTFTYGVAVWDGVIPAERIEKMYQEWLKLEK